ncbi:uncharacterized protein LOC134749074 [Cydia strobilella]|uniref:uncharacterized protein LOC134740474 n=1 Tax=Cydia strobilella TaxID=1100964 RepID=UPI0030056176
MSDIYNNNFLLYLLNEEASDDLVMLRARRKRNPVRPFYRCRPTEGAYTILIKNQLSSDDYLFRQYCRLNKQQFNFVLGQIIDEIQPKYQRAINAEEKLFLTLRFLASGETFRSLSLAYRISESYIARIVKHVLNVMRQKLVPLLMKPPSPNDFKRIEQEFWHRWNVPNCAGGIDGKHCRIRAPKNSGSLFFNYKNYYSIVLLAIVDANCKFVAVDVGAYGKESDNGIFQKSSMGKKIMTSTFGIPPPKSQLAQFPGKILLTKYNGQNYYYLTDLSTPESRSGSTTPACLRRS